MAILINSEDGHALIEKLKGAKGALDMFAAAAVCGDKSAKKQAETVARGIARLIGRGCFAENGDCHDCILSGAYRLGVNPPDGFVSWCQVAHEYTDAKRMLRIANIGIQTASMLRVTDVQVEEARKEYERLKEEAKESAERIGKAQANVAAAEKAMEEARKELYREAE